MVSVALLRPDRMRTLDLFDYIRHLDANGQTAQRYEIEFWRKVFYPLSCLVMIVLALPFAYLHFRQSGITTYVFGGVMIGISFFLLEQRLRLPGQPGQLVALDHRGRARHDLFRDVAGRLQLAGAAGASAMAIATRASSFSRTDRATNAGARRWRPSRGGSRTLDPSAQVVCAYLELVEPDLRTAAQA